MEVQQVFNLLFQYSMKKYIPLLLLLFACAKQAEKEPRYGGAINEAPPSYLLEYQRGKPPKKPRPVDTTTTPVDTTKPTDTVVTPPPVSYTNVTLPPVGNQAPEFSCIGWVISDLRFADWKLKTGQSVYFSPEYLYNNIKLDPYSYYGCMSGSSYVRALEWIKAYGISPLSSFPLAADCQNKGTAAQQAEAANYKISSYSAIYTSDTGQIKSLLRQGIPLAITIVTSNDFNYADANFIFKSYPAGNAGFNHAISICGYDDSKNAFRIKNSWGTNWGDAGYSWIDYNFLPSCAGMWCFYIN